jgi:hypothetical protein
VKILDKLDAGVSTAKIVQEFGTGKQTLSHQSDSISQFSLP